MNKFRPARPCANPEATVRKLLEIAHAFQPIQDHRIYIEVINGPMLFELKAMPAEYKAGLDCAIEKGWLELHESGTFIRFHSEETCSHKGAHSNLSRLG